MTALIELQYFPTIRFFAVLLQHERIRIEQHEHYQKRTYRNRCHIAAANGLLRLSVPLEQGKNNQQPIREVRIANDYSWQQQHWQAIQSAYGNAPYFEYYKDELIPIFFQKYDFLFDLNLALLSAITELLLYPVALEFTESYETTPTHVTDYRNAFTPKATDLPPPVVYPQVFADRYDFLPDLSVLDLLFCKGPESLLLFQQQNLSLF
jgi:hypothetical protein